LEFYDTQQKNNGFDFEYEQSGGLLILKSEEEKKSALELVGRQKKRSLELFYISTGEVQRIEPYFENDNISGAVYCPEEGRIEPFKVLTEIMSLLNQRGVKIIPRTEVSSFSIERGHIREVHTSNGSVKAEKVVLATGSWTREMAKKMGIDVPVFYHRGMAFVTIPVERCINNVIVSGGFLLKKKMPKKTVGLAVAQHSNGSIIIGQANDEGIQYSRDVSLRGILGIAHNFQKYFPSLRNLDVLRSWAGNTTYTEDGRCAFGYSSKIGNLFIAAGLKGAFSSALGAGRMAADIIYSGKYFPQIENLNPER
jgi:D-hydroxyproline dehydrogenase subunit beta